MEKEREKERDPDLLKINEAIKNTIRDKIKSMSGLQSE